MPLNSLTRLARLTWPALLALGLALPPTQAAEPKKVLHFAFSSAETSLDPAKIVDLYSRVITSHIFEALYAYDYLARPSKIKPSLAEGMPEVSPDFKVWTIKIKPGIYFADDPAFKGQKREVVAQDFIYTLKRIFDPAVKSATLGGFQGEGFVGMKALREEGIAQKKPFDYDRVVEGAKALDRYTLRFTLEAPRPQFLETLAQPDLIGVQAREVVEHYGDQIDAHPVGTGPYRLKQWRRSSLIALERNPTYRERYYDGEPAADDAKGQAILARMKGKRLPVIDEVQVQIIPESQPRWLAFLNGDIDALATTANGVPNDLSSQAMPNGKLAPNLAKRGIEGVRLVNSDVYLTVFNMKHPVVGGYTPEKVALRRAISLAYDVNREITLYWKGNAIPAQSPIVPHTSGYDPAFKSEMSDYDPARAKALLDAFGYVDRDGDGWRDLPDGSPLVLDMTTSPDQRFRILDELLKKSMDAVGIRTQFKIGQFQENLKAARAAKYMMWQLGSSAAAPDGRAGLARSYGPESGSQNLSHFQLAAFDKLYERMQQIPDGPEREALFLEAKRLSAAYMPMKNRVHRMDIDLIHPWLTGYRRPQFWQEWWHMIDIDESKKPH